jgi:hypothetical protein
MKTLLEPYSRYAATEDGKIFSLIKREPFEMKQFRDRDGYFRVTLQTKDSKKKQVIVSRVMYEAFNGIIEDGLVVRHIDGDNSNNILSNLITGTVLENNHDKKIHGTQCMGKTHGMAKISEEDVINIRKRIGEPLIVLSKEFGINKSMVSKIQLRQAWKHV